MTDKEITQIIKTRLTEQRFYHSLCVADEARILAAKYGCDADKAYTAGLLHDIMKNASNEEAKDFIGKYGIEMTPVELNAQKLWHAILGAVYVEKVLDIHDQDIINAVRYHTTAREGMSILEKVIYLADFTSADRDYPGVDRMRAAVRYDINTAMMIALKFSIEDLLKSDRAVHPDTLGAYNETVLNMR